MVYLILYCIFCHISANIQDKWYILYYVTYFAIFKAILQGPGWGDRGVWEWYISADIHDEWFTTWNTVNVAAFQLIYKINGIFYTMLHILPYFRRYYKAQDELIEAFEDAHVEINHEEAEQELQEALKAGRMANVMAKASFFINLVSSVGNRYKFLGPDWSMISFYLEMFFLCALTFSHVHHTICVVNFSWNFRIIPAETRWKW